MLNKGCCSSEDAIASSSFKSAHRRPVSRPFACCRRDRVLIIQKCSHGLSHKDLLPPAYTITSPASFRRLCICHGMTGIACQRVRFYRIFDHTDCITSETDSFGSFHLQIDLTGTTRFSSVLWEAEIAGHEMRMAKYTPHTIFSIFRPKSLFAVILRPYFASFLPSKLHLLPVPEGCANHVVEIGHFSKYTN